MTIVNPEVVEAIRRASKNIAVNTKHFKLPSEMAGVYFLWCGDVIIYVGCSGRILARICKHAQYMDFSSFSVMPEDDKRRRFVLESAFIKLLQPIENRIGTEEYSKQRIYDLNLNNSSKRAT